MVGSNWLNSSFKMLRRKRFHSNLHHCKINPTIETIVELADFVSAWEQATPGTAPIRFWRVFLTSDPVSAPLVPAKLGINQFRTTENRTVPAHPVPVRVDATCATDPNSTLDVPMQTEP